MAQPRSPKLVESKALIRRNVPNHLVDVWSGGSSSVATPVAPRRCRNDSSAPGSTHRTDFKMSEMKDIKLTYFNIMGLGETLRFMLSYMGKEFEDFRIPTFTEWISKYKKNMPFGKLPLLEIDGKPYHQTMSLCRWLGKKCNLAGDNDDEALEIDMMMDSFSDFRSMVWSYFYNSDKENKDKIRPRILGEVTPFYLQKFDDRIKEQGYLANRKLSWVDIYVVAVLGYFSFMVEFDICEKYENIRDLRDRVHAIPNIKQWVERRPQTNW